MKNLTIYFILFGLISCDTLQQVANTAGVSLNTETSAPALTNQEVISGLKEALPIGAKQGAQQASAALASSILSGLLLEIVQNGLL